MFLLFLSFFFFVFLFLPFLPFVFPCFLSILFSFVSFLFPFAFCFLSLFFFTPQPPGKDGNYKGRGGASLPLSSYGEGVGSWGGHCATTLESLARLVPSAPFIMVVGHEGVWVVSRFLSKWEREREI